MSVRVNCRDLVGIVVVMCSMEVFIVLLSAIIRYMYVVLFSLYLDSSQVYELRYTVLSGRSSMQPVELKPAELAAARNGPASGIYCVVFGGVQLEEGVLKQWLEACVKQVCTRTQHFCHSSIVCAHMYISASYKSASSLCAHPSAQHAHQ